MLSVSLDTHLQNFHLTIDFTAEQGKTTVLLGESGAGKSTVLRLIAGLISPQQGHISFAGTTYFDSQERIVLPPQRRPFGYVFQDYVLFPHLSVYENVAFGLRAQRLSRQIVQQRVSEALELVHLYGLEKRMPNHLSGGQQQRVAIARALALQPQLLLLDEPLSALDVQTRREVRQELRHLLSTLNITTVMVTHQHLEALLFGHHILVLDQGRIIQQGGQRDLLSYPRSSYVAELVGMNFFRGHLLQREGTALAVVQLQIDGQELEVIATLKEQAQNERLPEVGEEAFVVVDPRNITLYPQSPTGSARNVFSGEIIQLLSFAASSGVSDDGRVRVSIQIGSGAQPLVAEVTEASVQRMGLHEGARVYATFKATEAFVYT